MESLFDFQFFGVGEGLTSLPVTLTQSTTNVLAERRRTKVKITLLTALLIGNPQGAEGGDVKRLSYSSIRSYVNWGVKPFSFEGEKS
jgi:hypothetical protein